MLVLLVEIAVLLARSLRASGAPAYLTLFFASDRLALAVALLSQMAVVSDEQVR